jgi:arabinofuranosyltransferase
MSTSKKYVTFSLALVYILWAGAFIYRSSFIAIDGNRYYPLGDDAMISMRYAWNFSHGHGLVWNPGEYVEGYTNLLMVLVMSVATALLDKGSAVLAIQIFGVGIVIGVGFLSSAIMRILRGGADKDMLELLTLACVLFYFPLSYWSLLGMETGLLTFLLLAAVLSAFKWRAEKKNFYLLSTFISAGLAFLTRQDAIVPSALLFVFLFIDFDLLRKRKYFLSSQTWMILIYFLFVVGLTLFRYLYYGEWLPNTYTLKVGGVPLSARLYGGMVFIIPFIVQSTVLLVFSCLAMLREPSREKALLFFILISLMAYQVWVGGDAWPLWRMLAPGMPLVIILALWEIWELSMFVFSNPGHKSLIKDSVYVISLVGALMVSVNAAFWKDISFTTPPITLFGAARDHVNSAIAINNLTTENASVGVIWAGAVPYYTDRRGVDFLGKSDKYIARLAPDLTGDIGWNGIINVPGHIKYDLYYSINKLKPTYIEEYRWGKQNLSFKVSEDYVKANYQDVAGNVIILLRRSSPDVLWDKVHVEP